MSFQTQIIHDCQRGDQKLPTSKDVSCQTSDCEIVPVKTVEAESRSPSADRQAADRRRKMYTDHRRATDSLVSSRGRSEGRLVTVRKVLIRF